MIFARHFSRSIHQQPLPIGFIAVGVLLLFLVMPDTVTAQIIPSQPPIDTNVGGTGAAMESLLRISDRSGIKIMRNLRGPEKGWDRARSEVQVHSVDDRHVPGVDGYFLRSSYVTLDPGGVSPVHSHSRRPAFLQVISGRCYQHRSDGVSFVMGPGDFTFSSNDLAHWWINEDDKIPMKLWVVELCSAAHGCDKPVNGGALVALTDPAVTAGQAHLGETTVTSIMETKLSGEFADVETLGNRRLRLRRIRIPQGSSPLGYGEGESLTYFRIASGSLTRHDQDKKQLVKSGSIVLANHPPVGPTWSNSSEQDAVLFAIDIFNPGDESQSQIGRFGAH